LSPKKLKQIKIFEMNRRSEEATVKETNLSSRQKNSDPKWTSGIQTEIRRRRKVDMSVFLKGHL
jgi:hypothetical protein